MAIRSHKSKMTYNTLAKLKGAKGETMIYNTLHREPKIEQYEPHNYFPLMFDHSWLETRYSY